MRELVRDESSQPITNFARDPRATRFIGNTGIGFSNSRWAGDTSYSLLTGIVGPQGTDLTTAVRGTCVNIRAGLGFDLGSNPESGTPGGQLLPVTPGKRYSVEVWFQSSVPRDAITAIRFANGSAWSSVPAIVGSQVALAAGTWSLLTVTGIAPADATHMAMYAKYTNGALALNPGDYFMGTGLFVHEGAPILRYADGNSPGWKWTGTPNASESVGYSWTADTNIVRQKITNLVKNPRARTVDTLIREQLRNKVVNPGPMTNASGWTTNNGSISSPVFISSGGPASGSWIRSTTGAASSDLPAAASFTSGDVSGSPGEIVELSVDIHTAATDRSGILSLYARGANVYFGSVNVPLTPGSIQRVKVIATCPAGTTAVAPIFSVRSTSNAAVPAGEVTHMRRLHVGTPIMDYFDGDTTDTETISYEWTGTAGASSSVARSSYVEVRRNLCMNPAPPVTGQTGNGGWFALGQQKVTAPWGRGAVQANGNGANGCYLFPARASIGLVAGQTISLRVKIIGTAGCQFRARPHRRSSNTYFDSLASSWLTLTGAVQEVTHSFTVPAGESFDPNDFDFAFSLVGPVAQQAAPVGSYLTAGDIVYELNSGAGDFFYGDTTDGVDYAYEWVGTPNDSASVLRSRQVPSWNGSRITAPTNPPLTRMVDIEDTPFVRLTLGLAESHSVLIDSDDITYPAGTTATGMVRVRSNRATTIRPRMALMQGTPVALAANSWTWIAVTATIPAARPLALQPLINGSDARAGDTLDVSHALVYVHDPSASPNLTTFGFADGDTLAYGTTPAWQWNGTPHTSTSTGFPIRWESVDVRPLSEWTYGGGAYYDAANDEAVLPTVSSWVQMPQIPTLGTASMRWGFEYFTTEPSVNNPTLGASLCNSFYYSGDGITRAFNTSPAGPYNGNGRSDTYPLGVWTPKESGWTLGPAIKFMTHRVTGNSGIQANGYRMRKPWVRLER